MTLTDFLLARIAEDERAARWGDWCDTDYGPRVLAECGAKRRIVGEHPCDDEGYCGDDIGLAGCKWLWPCPTLRALALPHADHPDYREEWKP